MYLLYPKQNIYKHFPSLVFTTAYFLPKCYLLPKCYFYQNVIFTKMLFFTTVIFYQNVIFCMDSAICTTTQIICKNNKSKQFMYIVPIYTEQKAVNMTKIIEKSPIIIWIIKKYLIKTKVFLMHYNFF